MEKFSIGYIFELCILTSNANSCLRYHQTANGYSEMVGVRQVQLYELPVKISAPAEFLAGFRATGGGRRPPSRGEAVSGFTAILEEEVGFTTRLAVLEMVGRDSGGP